MQEGQEGFAKRVLALKKNRVLACIAACVVAGACVLGVSGCASEEADAEKEEALAALDSAFDATNEVQNVCYQDGTYNLSAEYMGSEGSFDGIIDVHYIVPEDSDSFVSQLQAAMSTSGEMTSGSGEYFEGDSISDNSFSFNAYIYESSLYFDMGGSLLGGETEKLRVDVTDEMIAEMEGDSDSSDSDGELEFSDFADYIDVEAYDGSSIEIDVDVRSVILQEYSAYLYEEYGEYVEETDEAYVDFLVLDDLKSLGSAIGDPELELAATIADDGTLSSLSVEGDCSFDPLALMTLASEGYHDFSSYFGFFSSDLEIEFSASIPTITASSDQSITFPDFSGYQSYEELMEEYGDYYYDYDEDEEPGTEENPYDDVSLPSSGNVDCDDGSCSGDSTCDDGACDADPCDSGTCTEGTCSGSCSCGSDCSGCDDDAGCDDDSCNSSSGCDSGSDCNSSGHGHHGHHSH